MGLLYGSQRVLAVAVLVAMTSAPALAKAAVVKVTLWDKGEMSMSMLGKGPAMGMGMGMSHGGPAAPPMGPMGITLDQSSVKAGNVTFAVTNASRVLVHEMVVSPVKSEGTPLPYDKAAMKVEEDAAGHLGEVSELEPGKNGALTLDMKPGRYILYCNIPGHYALGMWTLITVN